MPLTVAFILMTTFLVIAAVAIFDVWTIRKRGSKTSISWILLTSAQRQPIIAAVIGFAVGILFGHFWWVND